MIKGEKVVNRTCIKNVTNMNKEIKRQLKYFNERYEEVICSPQLKWNEKYKTPELEDYTPIIAIRDLLDYNFVICAIPDEEVKYLLCQFDRTDKVIAEYDSMEEMVEDGWCMGT